MSTAMQETKPKAGGLRAWVATSEAQQEIAAAVGDIMPADQFIAHMLVAFQDEKVRKCSDQSKFRAMKECAALGLLPTLGQVSLIPYGPELKATPEWEGLKAVMERHPDVLEVVGVLVHKDDHLIVQEGQLQHCFDPFDENRNIDSAKDLRGGYCKIVYRDGRPPKYHFVTRKHLEKVRGCAQTQKIWEKWYYQMALKTLYRDAYARRAVPIDPLVNARLERIVKADDLNLGNDPMRISSEASAEHMEQAREQREAAEHEPPAAGETSQVDPTVEAHEGVDEPPEPTSDQQEAHWEAEINKVRVERTLNQVAGYIGADQWLNEAAVGRLNAKVEGKRAAIQDREAARSNTPASDGERFPTGAQ